jgi:hypothetical protein
VEGFFNMTSQLAVGEDLVVLAVCMRVHHSGAHSMDLSLYIFSVGVVVVSGSILYCVYCNPSFSFFIYTHRSQTGFTRGGFVQVMLTKNTCVYKCMILVLRYVHNQL